MADFSFHSENEDSDVDAIISEAKDLVFLEQIASMNLSGVSGSALPTDIETRFRKLKSFPEAKPKDQNRPSCSDTKLKATHTTLNIPENILTSGSDEVADTEFHESEFMSSRGAKKINPDRDRSGSKVVSKSSSSSISSASRHKAPPSPPRQACCFWSPPKKNSKENRAPKLGLTELDWGKSDEFLSDLSTFSEKEQKRRLKKALKEEEKISREAEKVVEWAKQASASINGTSGIEDVSSDDEEGFKH